LIDTPHVVKVVTGGIAVAVVNADRVYQIFPFSRADPYVFCITC
jgi:hypothetical protein